MSRIRFWSLFTATLISAAVFAWYFWPTPYHFATYRKTSLYTDATTDIPLRINRFTGRAASLTQYGWRRMPTLAQGDSLDDESFNRWMESERRKDEMENPRLKRLLTAP